ncbi:MAG: MFS transporter [Aggregatilineales bacterium]
MDNQHQYSVKTFYTIIITQVLSITGSQISGLAIGIWLYAETGDATPLALVAFFNSLPRIVLANVSGYFADRMDRRYVMALSDAGQALGTILLLISFSSGEFEIWHLYAITVLQAIFGVFQGPSMLASITLLVPDEKRPGANAIMQLMQPTSGIIAPVMAGLIYAAGGVIGAIAIDMISFSLAVLVILNIRIPRPEQTDAGAALKTSFWREISGGFRYILARQGLLLLVMYAMVLNFLLAGMGVAMTPYLLARTDSEALYGLIISLINGGMLAGGIFMGVWGGTKRRMYTIIFGTMVVGIVLIFFGMAQTVPMLMLTAFVYIVPIPMVNASVMTLLQSKVAPDVQGRVFAVVEQLAMLLAPASFLLVGFLADNVFEPAVGTSAWSSFAPYFGTEAGAGIGLMIALSGLSAAIVSVLAYLTPAMRNMEEKLPDYVPTATPDIEPAAV